MDIKSPKRAPIYPGARVTRPVVQPAIETKDKSTRSSRTPPHPGETIKEYLENKKWTQADLSRATKLSTKTISTLCEGKSSLTARIALRLEAALERPALFWMTLQVCHDLGQERLKAL
jgi:HTH-type transcriptional regulator/antitoxin HigA